MSGEAFDVCVVGAGIGGIYAAYRFQDQGLSVLGLEGAPGVGGVWYHNAYPGSRVDTDSVDYCYHFSPELYQKWRWTERYGAQPELLAYLNFVADDLGVRTAFKFETWLCDAHWSEEARRWQLTTHDRQRYSCRFLVMCTGNLTEPRPPDFPGLDRFRGEWVVSSRYPEDVQLDGRRVAIIGTGSSAVQAVPVVAQQAEHLLVFQRTPHYVVPARNGPIPDGLQLEIAANLLEEREKLFTEPVLPRGMVAPRPLANYSAKERMERLEWQWDFGGHGMSHVFSDEQVDLATNMFVADYVREKIHSTVKDQELAAKLCPTYPIGTHRLALDIGYYESFNQDNVSFVDVKAAPIVEITQTGIRTADALHEADLVIFALGFQAFHGALDGAGVRSTNGLLPSQVWDRGPHTILGLMTPGFPNMFTPTGAGSPSVYSHLFLGNEFHIEWISDCLDFMERAGHTRMEASDAAADDWGRVAEASAEKLLRRQEDNYMVHVNADDGSRIFIPFGGGMHEYVPRARDIAARGYDGFVFA